MASDLFGAACAGGCPFGVAARVRIVIRLVDLEAELADPMERASGIGKLKELAFNRFAGMFGS